MRCTFKFQQKSDSLATIGCTQFSPISRNRVRHLYFIAHR